VPDYDPLTISDEDLKKLPPAERGAVYKARRAAAGGAPPAPRPAPAATQGAPASQGAPANVETPVPTAGASAPAAAPAAAPKPAAPAPPPAAPKPAPPKEPEKPAEPAFVQNLLKAIPEATFQWRHGYAELKIPRERLLEASSLLKAQGFDYLSFISEVDWQQHLELVYHLFAYDYRTQPLGAILRCELPREDMSEVASVTPIWPGAEFMEREAYEMMGINFLGHPDLRRILLPDDFVGFPMRRDYETDYDYVTVKQLVHETD
jgi:NADH-quinone oxidoreductase subunit C